MNHYFMGALFAILTGGLGALIHLMTGLTILVSVGWAFLGMLGIGVYFICLTLALMFLPNLKNAKFNGWK